jgi:hypothetical protein
MVAHAGSALGVLKREQMAQARSEAVQRTYNGDRYQKRDMRMTEKGIWTLEYLTGCDDLQEEEGLLLLQRGHSTTSSMPNLGIAYTGVCSI